MTVRIVMDDAGDVPAELARTHHLYIVPISVAFGTEEYLTGINLDRPGFYEKVKTVTNASFPKTSQPTPYQFEEIYRRALADGATELIVVTVSEKLSGTYASAMAAAESLGDQAPVYVFDSQSGSAAQGLMAVAAAELASQGVPTAHILDALVAMRQQATIYLLIDSLDFAVRGGRVSSLQSGVASLLNIKPVMTVAGGLIVPAARVRTMTKALQRIVDETRALTGDRLVNLAAVHANAPEAGAQLLEMARPHFNIQEAYLLDLALSVAVNLGPGAVGLVTVPALATLTDSY
jgi:DegV family protein with EDD domain